MNGVTFPSSFNSIKVRLIRILGDDYQQIIVFQFHKGSINTTVLAGCAALLCSFNSIKVRLIPTCEHDLICEFVFQFHKGSINTDAGLPVSSSDIKFQFHKGSINTSLIINIRLRRICFNSIKVRLIPSTLTLLNKVFAVSIP